MHFDADDFCADCDHLADHAAECQHGAGHGRWNLDRGLVGHHVDQVLVFGHGVAYLHVPLDQFDFGNTFADVGHLDDVDSHHASIARLNALATRSGPGK